MRAIVLAVPAMMMLFAIAPAEAARRGEQATARQAAAFRTQTSRPVAASAMPRGRVLSAAHAAPARHGRPAASAPTRQASACIRGAAGFRGAARCGSTRIAWQGGLAPAAGVQTAECPEGTMATLATGHANVVRCMPI